MGKITIREVRILLDETTTRPLLLALKICVNQQIFKFKQLKWNSLCQRWENQEDICLHVNPPAPLEIQLYDPKASNLDCVLGETLLDLNKLPSPLTRELRLCLSFDGLVVGWLYCELLRGEVHFGEQRQYIHIHKLALSFLEKEEQCSLTILLNSTPIFHKDFRLSNRARTLYPNIKQSVKKSDLLVFSVQSTKLKNVHITLLIDRIKCGQTAFTSLWLKDVHKKKQGELNLEYFLDNLYLENEEWTFTRKYRSVSPENKVITLEQPITREELQTIREITINRDQLKRNERLKKTILGPRQFSKTGEEFLVNKNSKKSSGKQMFRTESLNN